MKAQTKKTGRVKEKGQADSQSQAKEDLQGQTQLVCFPARAQPLPPQLPLLL